MARYIMAFTRHFVTQLDNVLNHYAIQYVGESYSIALLELVRAHLSELLKLLKEPIRSSLHTNRPRIRYFMVFDVNITFHISKGRITILNITF